VTRFSPLFAMRCWVNPVSEPDVTFVAGVLIDGAEDPGDSGDLDGSAADESDPAADLATDVR
jgi:hypothetical protein